VSALAVGLRGLLAELDPASLTGDSARRLFAEAAEVERLVSALKLLLAPALKASSPAAGHRSVEEWMASASGTSLAEAHKTIAIAENVSGLPTTGQALRSGELSIAQVEAVASAAVAAPASEAKLLLAARSETVRELQSRSRRVVLESRGTVEERYARQRRLRSFAHWVDDEGMVAGRFRLTPDAGSAVVKAIQRQADRHFRLANRQARRESPESYAADALVDLVTGGARKLTGPRGGADRRAGREVVVVVSHEALRRGFVADGSDEVCEVPGFGAVPVAAARGILADCFLKAVVVDGTRVTHVKHFGRHRRAEIDTALLVQGVVGRGSVRCSADGCDRQVGLEWDHVQPFAKGGPTSVDNLQPLCRFHHRQKTAAQAGGAGGIRVRRRGPPEGSGELL